MAGLLNALKFAHKMFTDGIQFVVAVRSRFVRYAGRSI